MGSDEYTQITKAAWYYYQEGLTQQQVAHLLGVSRVKVARLLELARQEGIIHFSFRSGTSERMQVESDLISSFGLRDAFVVPAPLENASLSSSLAHAAATYIVDHIPEGGFLNMGYGETTSKVLNYLARDSHQTINVCSLTGGVNYYLPNVDSSLRNIRLYLIPSPLLLSSSSVRDEVMREPSVQEVYRMVSHASMSIMSVGGMAQNSTIIKNGILSANDLTYLKMYGAVGDILSHFIDEKGEPVSTDFETRLISTDLDILTKLDTVIGVAGGDNKIPTLRAALTRGYFDVLVTDETTAATLLE